MVNVVNKKCGHVGCSTIPSYGVAGRNKAEFCSKHARSGMVNVKHRKCGYEGCSTLPSYGVAGSNKAVFCSKHASSGMVNVVNKKCGYEGCSTKSSFGVAANMKAGFCPKHARSGILDVVSEKCEKGWLKSTVDKRHTVDEAKVCRQHTFAHDTAAAPDTAKLHSGEGTPLHSPTKVDGGSVADVRGTKRKHPGFSGSVINDGVGARRSAFAGPRQVVRTKHPASGAGEMFLEASAGDWMEVKLAVRSATHGGDTGREGREQPGRSIDWTNEGRRSSVFGSGSISSGRLCGSPAMARGRLGTFHVDFEQVEENSNVKLELGVSSRPPRAYDTL
ncbi:unnamed protein product [Sphacelaria rigidula]